MKIIVDRMPRKQEECLFHSPSHGCKITNGLVCSLKNVSKWQTECEYLKVNGLTVSSSQIIRR